MKPKPAHLGPEYGAQFQDASVATVYRKRPPYPADLFSLLTRLLPEADTAILDVGSGTGEIAIPLAASQPNVQGLEPSAAMLAVARQQPGSSAVHWHHSSAESFDFDQRYGLIICAQCLGWLDWNHVFPRFKRALSESGWLVLVDQQTFQNQPWQAELGRIIARYSTNQEFQPFNLVDGLIERGLFAVAGSESTTAEPFSQTVENFVESIHARNGFSRQRMTEKAATAFDQEASELLHGYHPGGRLSGTNAATVTWGRPLL